MHAGTGRGVCKGGGKFHGEFGIGRTCRKETTYVLETR